jgi:hypothetical protein
VLSKSDAELWSSSLFNPILIAERVSDKNTRNDFGKWIGEIMNAAILEKLTKKRTLVALDYELGEYQRLFVNWRYTETGWRVLW